MKVRNNLKRFIAKAKKTDREFAKIIKRSECWLNFIMNNDEANPTAKSMFLIVKALNELGVKVSISDIWHIED